MTTDREQRSAHAGDQTERDEFRAIADRAPVMLWATDAEGSCVFLNQSWYEFTGQTPEEALGVGWLEAVHPEDRERSGETFFRSLRERKAFRLDYRLRRHDGAYFWAIDSGVPRFAADGTLEGYVGSVLEIEDRRRMEEALRASERRHRRIFELIDVSIWEEDFSAVAAALRELRAQGVSDLRAYLEKHPEFLVRMAGLVRVVRVNEATLRMFRARTRAELGESLERIFLPETLAVFAEELITLFEGRTRLRADAPLRTVDGRRIEVAFSITFPSDDPDARSVLVSLIDVTQRKRVEEGQRFLAEASRALGASLEVQATLATVAQLAVPRFGDWCVVHVLDERGRLSLLGAGHIDRTKVELVRELQRRYPPNLDERIGIPSVIRSGVSEIISPITDAILVGAARDEEHLERLRGLKLCSAMIVPIVTRDRVLGAISFVSAESGYLYGDEDLPLAEELGRRAGAALENAQLYATTQRARAEAESANAVKSQFLATMSHELRTPLNAIGGYSDLLRLGVRGPVTTEQADDLDRIVRNQQHLLSLINDILNFAKLEAGRVRFDIEDVNVQELLESLEESVKPQITAKRLGYRCQPCGGDVAVRADRERASQVLLNLLSNAVKYTESGGRIAVVCEVESTTVAIKVSDTGVGIPHEKLPHIFDPFVQIGRNASRPAEGIGLGLAISNDLAKGMGGELAVASTVGKGSTFTLRLPRATSERA